jgi:hypothetical protein
MAFSTGDHRLVPTSKEQQWRGCRTRPDWRKPRAKEHVGARAGQEQPVWRNGCVLPGRLAFGGLDDDGRRRRADEQVRIDLKTVTVDVVAVAGGLPSCRRVTELASKSRGAGRGANAGCLRRDRKHFAFLSSRVLVLQTRRSRCKYGTPRVADGSLMLCAARMRVCALRARGKRRREERERGCRSLALASVSGASAPFLFTMCAAEVLKACRACILMAIYCDARWRALRTSCVVIARNGVDHSDPCLLLRLSNAWKRDQRRVGCWRSWT